jgi:hypothetical protein
MAIKNRATLRRQIDQLLSVNPERLIIAHGPVIENNAAKVLRRAFAWVKPLSRPCLRPSATHRTAQAFAPFQILTLAPPAPRTPQRRLATWTRVRCEPQSTDFAVTSSACISPCAEERGP